VRRAGIAIVACVALVAVLAPALTPNQPDFRFPDRAYAPPMPIRLIDGGGRWRAPFVYPIRLADRLERRFEEDRANPVPIAWFSRGVVAQVSDARQGPWLPLGADGSGRDVFARLVYGARLSLAVALAATLGAMLIGTLVGGSAGAAGGIVDEVLMRLSDFVIVLPAMYVVLSLRAALPLVLPPARCSRWWRAFSALVGWPIVARGVRAIVAAERERDYAQAAAPSAPGARGCCCATAAGGPRLSRGAGRAAGSGLHPGRGHPVVRGPRLS